MKNLPSRIISGGIFVLLTIGSILLSKYAFVSVFALMLVYTLYEFYRLCRGGGHQPQTILGIIVALYLFISFFLYDMKIVGEIVFFGLIPLLFLSPVIELFSKNERPIQNIAYTFMGIIYIAVPFSILNFIITPIDLEPQRYMPEVLIGLFLIIWSNDSGAFAVGSFWGRTKMLERVSPKKTWEGAIGGAFFALLASFLLHHYFDFMNLWQAFVLAMLCVVSGTIGDLTESLIKRSFNVKDSGTLLPGHGGLLDRFDSLLFAAPVYYIFISLILNN